MGYHFYTEEQQSTMACMTAEEYAVSDLDLEPRWVVEEEDLITEEVFDASEWLHEWEEEWAPAPWTDEDEKKLHERIHGKGKCRCDLCYVEEWTDEDEAVYLEELQLEEQEQMSEEDALRYWWYLSGK